jgi:putative ABC transport system permease protein
MLGVQPILGRSFSPAEEKSGANQVVLIGHGLWQRRFGADPSLVGKRILLGDVFGPANSYTVIGIMPPGFDFPQRGSEKAEFWVPLAMDTEAGKDRENRWLAWGIGCLKPGVSLPQAQAEMNAIARRLETVYPDTNKGWRIDLVFLHDQTVKNARRALLVLLAAVGFVLLIACVNVANLLLSRSLARQKEMSIRAALGAGRWRVIRQLLIESVLLSLLGGLAGVVLVLCGFKLIVSVIPGDMPRLGELSIDGSVFWFTLAVSIVTGVLFGLAPALQLSKPSLNLSLAESNQGSTTSGQPSRLPGLLVVAECAMAMILLVGAGLLLQTLVRLRAVPLSFNPENVLTLGIQLPYSRYPNEPQQIAFYDSVLSRIAALPTVVSVGAVRELPVGSSARTVITPIIEGRPEPKPGDKQWASPVAVSLGYFQTMGIQLLKGRGFTEQDREGALEVAIINEAMAKRFWAGEDPIGKRFKWANSPWSWFTVVGIIKDARQVGEETKHLPEFYRPMTQFPNMWMTIVVKTTANPIKSAAQVRSQIWAVDKDLPIQKVRTLEGILSAEVVRPRFYARLVGAFAVFALILTAVGVYGVMAYGISRRTREIGIRMALGADRSRVLKLVLRQGMTLALAGVALGMIGACALTRYASSLLYGIKAADPVTFVFAGVLLAGVALAACLGPAHRATRIDPMTALRYE